MKRLAIFMFLLFITLTGCSSNNDNVNKLEPYEEHYYIKNHVDEFFKVDVSLEEEYKGVYPNGKNHYERYWIINLSPVTDKYTFIAASKMNVIIHYSWNRGDTGEFEYSGISYDISYDKNGYGYAKKAAPSIGSNIIFLSADLNVSPFETAKIK